MANRPGLPPVGRYVVFNVRVTSGFPFYRKYVALSFIDNIRSSALNEPIVYATVSREDGKVAIQYWLYYYYNGAANGHEGDWEMIQVMIGDDGNPTHAAFAQHGTATKREWSSVEQLNETHPVVYSAKGSHASYFYPAKYLAKDIFLKQFHDETANYRYFDPKVRYIHREAPPAWINYRGRWGEKNFIEDLKLFGPESPGMQDKWENPFDWFRNVNYDDDNSLTYHNDGKFILQGSQDCNWSVTDKNTGKRWGIFNGVEYNEISNVETILTTEVHRKTVIFHDSYRDYMRFDPKPSMNGCLPMPPPPPTPGGAYSTLNIDGELLATIYYANSMTNEIKHINFAYPEDWDPDVSLAHFSLLDSDTPQVELDINGDSEIDNVQDPIAIETTPLYTVPTAEFLAMPSTGAAPLTVGFVDLSESLSTSWTWNFGDGLSAFEQNPSHTFDRAGKYSVTLIVSNPAGSNTVTRQGLITVLPSITNFEPSSGLPGSTVSIFGISLDDVIEVRFDGVLGTHNIISESQIEAIVPLTASTGKITIASSEGTVSSIDDFTIINPPNPASDEYPEDGAFSIPINIICNLNHLSLQF